MFIQAIGSSIWIRSELRHVSSMPEQTHCITTIRFKRPSDERPTHNGTSCGEDVMADLLTRKEIEQITGIVGSPIRQRNWLKKSGIHCILNEAHQVVVWRAWVDIAALPPELLKRYIPQLPANDDDEDIGLNFEALNG
jgi:hypothetical protein